MIQCIFPAPSPTGHLPSFLLFDASAPVWELNLCLKSLGKSWESHGCIPSCTMSFLSDKPAKKIKGPDNRTSQLLPIINEKLKLKRDGEGKKGKGGGGRSINQKTLLRGRVLCVCYKGVMHEDETVVCARVVCATVLRDKAGLPSDALQGWAFDSRKDVN